MSNDALFDVFEQAEPTPIVELPNSVTIVQQTNGDSISKDKRTLEEGDDDEMDQSDLNFKRSRIDDTNTER